MGKSNRHVGDEQEATEQAVKNNRDLWPYTEVDK